MIIKKSRHTTVGLIEVHSTIYKLFSLAIHFFSASPFYFYSTHSLGWVHMLHISVIGKIVKLFLIGVPEINGRTRKWMTKIRSTFLLVHLLLLFNAESVRMHFFVSCHLGFIRLNRGVCVCINVQYNQKQQLSYKNQTATTFCTWLFCCCWWCCCRWYFFCSIALVMYFSRLQNRMLQNIW